MGKSDFTTTNNNCFTAFVWDYPDELVPEETFNHSHKVI